MPRGMANWRFIDAKRFLNDHNFILSHVQGSHYFYVGSYDRIVRQVCIPFHGNKTIHPKTMKSIARQSGIPISKWKT